MAEDNTPTNVVDDLPRQNQLINNFVNSVKKEGNLEFYVKHSGTQVPASSIKYNPRIGIGSQIPGFYTEPLGIRDIKTMGGVGGPNAINNYYKVQVNSNNLLIDAVSGEVTGLKSPITGMGNMYLGEQINKIDWNIFEQETGLNFEKDFVGANKDPLAPYQIQNGKKFTRKSVQDFIRNLKTKGLTDDEIASVLRKSGIEGFVTGPTNAQYEVVLLDPNDELNIGKNINVQDATETDFVNNQSKVNQIDELVTDTPTNVVDDVVVTSATENLKQTIPTNADGNIVLYRATTDPNVKVLSDFTDINRSNQAGLGKQNFYAIDEMYAYNYSRPSINKNVYKFETNIKPSEVLNFQTPTNQQLDVLEKIGINAEDLKKWDMPLSENSVNTKIQNNLDYLLENNIKAIGNNKFGGSPGVFDYEIVPIITEKTQTEIKPVSQLILDPNWEGTDRILNVENELFQSTQSTQWADKYLPIDINDPNTKYRPVYYVDEEGIGRKAKDFQFSKQPIENNLVKDNLIQVPIDTNTNVELVKDKYVLNTDTPTNVVGNEFVDNIVNANTQLVNDLPLSETVKKQFDNVVRNRAKNLVKPSGVADAVDVWELGVLGLMITAIAYKEFDEIPTIFKRTATNMFNAVLAPYNIPPVPLEQYDLDYEFIEKVITTGEKVMPTDIIIKKVQEKAEEFEGESTASGYAYMTPSPKNTDTMETTQKIQPGVQEEKMFEKAKPKKIKSTGGSGAKIL